MEGVSTWSQVQVFGTYRLEVQLSTAVPSALSPVDLDLSARDFCSTKTNLAEGNLTWLVIVFCRFTVTVGAASGKSLFSTSRVFSPTFVTSTVPSCLTWKGDVGYFEVTGWIGFLMESVSCASQAQFFGPFQLHRGVQLSTAVPSALSP